MANASQHPAQTERHVGSVAVDSAQIVITDPINLGSEDRYQRVVDLTLEKGAGAIVDLDGQGLQSSDGVAVETGGDGSFPVYVTYDDAGRPVSVRIDLR